MKFKQFLIVKLWQNTFNAVNYGQFSMNYLFPTFFFTRIFV